MKRVAVALVLVLLAACNSKPTEVVGIAGTPVEVHVTYDWESYRGDKHTSTIDAELKATKLDKMPAMRDMMGRVYEVPNGSALVGTALTIKNLGKKPYEVNTTNGSGFTLELESGEVFTEWEHAINAKDQFPVGKYLYMLTKKLQPSQAETYLMIFPIPTSFAGKKAWLRHSEYSKDGAIPIFRIDVGAVP